MRLTWSIGPPAEELRGPWNALVLRMEQPQVFYTWEWASAFARVCGKRMQPWIATAYEQEELVGVVALARISISEAAFLSGTTADYCDFVSAPETRRQFVGLVLEALRADGIRTLVLANLPADSGTAAEIAASHAYRSFVRTGYLCAQVRLGDDEERRTLAKSLSKKKMLRRSINALGRLGPVALRHNTGSEPLGDSLEIFFLTHVARFLATGRISNLVSAERRGFLRELADLLAPQGWFDLSSLCAGNQVVASNYGFRFHGSWFWYQPTFVNELEGHSPGYCLLAKLVEAAAADPAVHVVDLGLGAEGYKERFANSQRKTLHATLAADTGTVWRARWRHGSAEKLKRFGPVEGLARLAQRFLHEGQRHIEQSGWRSALVAGGRRVQRSVTRAEEVLLFRWPAGGEESAGQADLHPISWTMLARTAIQHAEDRESLDYLLRSAVRLQSAQNQGVALLDAMGAVEHCAWVAPYQGFSMRELGILLQAPNERSVLIIDCWTPPALRGRSLYARAIRSLAMKLSRDGQDVWIFSAATNGPSLAGIRKAGFQLHATLRRRKVLWWSNLTRYDEEAHEPDKPGAVSGPTVR